MPESLQKSVQRLGAFCRENQLGWDDSVARGFETYVEILLHFNRAMNLIGPLDEAQIVDQLLIDSVAAAAVSPPKEVDGGAGILDVGSGAGLPGIPLKLLFPEIPITLVEPRAKRTIFLKIAVERLGLSRVTIARCRLEELAPGRFDYVISKAFRAPVTWLELAADRVSPGGQIICMTRPEVRAELVERADALGLIAGESCDDTTALGAPSVGEKRAVFAFGASA